MAGLIWRRIPFLFIVFACLSRMGSAAAAPAIFFYPPPLKLADGSTVATVPTLSAAEITTLFPAVPEMSGVVLIVNWSQLCPAANDCDFSIIDQVLAYWAQRKKMVVLAVATVGFPYKVLEQGQARYESATPQWVLDQVTTYEAPTQGFGRIHNDRNTVARFPYYADPRFASLIGQLVHKLARYDGSPTIAQIRVSTGLLTEDNPSPAGPRWLIPGYRDLDWIEYCREMVDLYLKEFHHSQLEFDLGFTSLAYARGGPEVKRAVDRLYAHFIVNRLFIGYNGLRSTTLGMLSPAADPRTGVPRGLQYLLKAQKDGCAIGLEGGPLTADFMQDIGSIAETVQRIHPSRLVLWATEAAVLNKERSGANITNETALEWLSSQPNSPLESTHVHLLLTRIGLQLDQRQDAR
jgi:hypothetical protein